MVINLTKHWPSDGPPGNVGQCERTKTPPPVPFRRPNFCRNLSRNVAVFSAPIANLSPKGLPAGQTHRPSGASASQSSATEQRPPCRQPAEGHPDTSEDVICVSRNLHHRPTPHKQLATPIEIMRTPNRPLPTLLEECPGAFAFDVAVIAKGRSSTAPAPFVSSLLRVVAASTCRFVRPWKNKKPATRIDLRTRSTGVAGCYGPLSLISNRHIVHVYVASVKKFPRPRPPEAIAFFNLGCHGLTVFRMAVRICQRHGHGEDAKTVPPDFRFDKGNSPARPPHRLLVTIVKPCCR